MLALACFRTARPGRLDQLLDATRLCGLGVGASGYSAAVMAAEQGKDQERELRILRQRLGWHEDPIVPLPAPSNRCFLVTTGAQKPPVRVSKQPVGGC